MTDYTEFDAVVHVQVEKVLAPKNAQIAQLQADMGVQLALVEQLQADLAECEAGHPPVDTTPPSASAGLTATVISSTQINLTWGVATDNVGVVGYNIFRDGVEIGQRVGTNYADQGLTPATSYSYTVKARDAAGNLSSDSNKVTATTLPVVVPPTGDFVWKGLDTPQLKEAWMKANTGPRIALTPATSNKVSGTVSGKLFTGTVDIAEGAILKDAEVVVTDGFGINGEGKNYTLENVRVRCTGSGNRYQGVLGNFTATRCDVSGFEDGFRPTGAHVMRASYVHNLSSASAAHNDGIQVFSGPGLIEQNFIMARDTSAVMVQSFSNSASSAPKNVIVRHNYLGGADLPLRIESECKGKGCQAYENIIQKGHWGYSDVAGADAYYGNIDAVTGASV